MRKQEFQRKFNDIMNSDAIIIQDELTQYVNFLDKLKISKTERLEMNDYRTEIFGALTNYIRDIKLLFEEMIVGVASDETHLSSTDLTKIAQEIHILRSRIDKIDDIILESQCQRKINET